MFGHVFEAIPGMPSAVGRALIYHSIGPKTGRYNPSIRDMHVLFVESQHFMDQLSALDSPCELVLTGYSKLDPLFGDNVSKNANLLETMGLDPAQTAGCNRSLERQRKPLST